MRTVRTAWVCLLGACLFAPVLRTLADAKPYDVIPDRNVFKLKPLPPPPDPNAVPPTPPSNVTLTGITDILGDKMALMEEQPQGKPKIYLMLSEGQRDGDVTVVSINQTASTVTIKNVDQTQTLDLNAAAKRAASASTVASVNPGGSPIPTPGGVNSIRDLRANGIQARRDMRTVSSGDVPPLPGSGSGPSLPSSGDMSSGGAGIGTNPRTSTAKTDAPVLSPEEQLVQNAAAQVNPDPHSPPVPPAPPFFQKILNEQAK